MFQVHIFTTLFGCVFVVLSSCSCCSKLVARTLVAPSLHSYYSFLSCCYWSKLAFLLFFSIVFLLLQACVQMCYSWLCSCCSKLMLECCSSQLCSSTQSSNFFENLSMLHLVFWFFALCFGLCFLALWLQVSQDGCSSCALLMMLLFKVLHCLSPF
jgi:hypothetical protein